RLRFRGAELVSARDVQHERRAYVRSLVERGVNADAVVADRAVWIETCGEQVCELPAEAVADRACATVARRVRAQELEARRRVLDGLRFVESFIELEGALPVFFGLVRQLHIRLLPPEEVWADDDEAARGVPVGGGAHHFVDAEDFLQEHEARAPSDSGQREVRAELAAVERLDCDHMVSFPRGPSCAPRERAFAQARVFSRAAAECFCETLIAD